jgi:membrane-associated phospholipid phosphatase
VPADELEVRLLPDAVLTVGMWAVGFLLDASKVDLAGDLSCPEPLPPGAPAKVCDARALNPLDRWAAELSVNAAGPVSDALLATSLSLPLAFSGLDLASDRRSSAAERLGKDTLVIAQTYAATFLVTNVVKVAVRRLRPYNYNPSFIAQRVQGDSRLSFPSGHTSMAFAGAATLAVLLDQRFPGEPWAVATAVGGFTLAASTAAARVLAGRHFPTDVLVGAALGTTLGFLVPSLHAGRDAPSTPSDARPVGLAVGGRF